MIRRINVTLPDPVDDLLRRAASGGTEADYVRTAIIEKAARDAGRAEINELRARLELVEADVKRLKQRD